MLRVGLVFGTLLAATAVAAAGLPDVLLVHDADPLEQEVAPDRQVVEKGPPPRVIAETRPPTSGGPPRAEVRSRPPDGYAAVEEVEPSATPRRVPWLRYGLIALGLTAVGYWALRRNRPNPAEGT